MQRETDSKASHEYNMNNIASINGSNLVCLMMLINVNSKALTFEYSSM